MNQVLSPGFQRIETFKKVVSIETFMSVKFVCYNANRYGNRNRANFMSQITKLVANSAYV